MNRRSVKVVAAAGLFLIVSLCVGHYLSRPVVYAVSRVMLKNRRTNAGGYNIQLREISDFLSSKDAKEILARSSTVSLNSFQCAGVNPVRSTDIVRVEYQGFDSNIVWNVASNAAVLVRTVYATNQPGTMFEYIDTEFFQPRSPWSKFVEGVKGLFY
jgi:hypothetical protein